MASHFKRTDVGAREASAQDFASEQHDRKAADGDTITEPVPLRRHARRPESAFGDAHGTDASVTGAFQRLGSSVTGSFATLSDDVLRPIDTPAVADDNGTPRPIGVDPQETGAFARIPPEMAARAVTRDTAADVAGAARARRGARKGAAAGADEGKGRLPLVAVMAVAVVATGILLAAFLLRPAQTDEDVEPAEQTQVAPDEPITSAGSTYELVDAGDGTHVLTVRLEGSDASVNVAVINGDPACLLTYEGAIIIPESFGDGTWDVIAYTPGGDALATQVVDGEGAPVHGQGSVTEARIEGADLIVVDSTGATATISLGA